MKIISKNNRIYFNDEDKSFINITTNSKTNSAFIDLVKVVPEYRNNKLATNLMNKVLNYIKSKGFNIVSLNPLPLDQDGLNLNQLIKFYKKFDFLQSAKKDISYPYLMSRII